MSIGTLTLDRFNGQERFAIAEATILTFEDAGDFAISFYIETTPGPLATLDDTRELDAQPNAEFTVCLNAHSWDTFVGSRYIIPAGDDDGNWLARLYYCEHEPVDNVLIEVVESKEGAYRAQITGTCMDVNYYDGSKPPTQLTINAWFELHEA